MSSQNKEEKHFGYLDGYRGFLAIFVVITHSKMTSKCELVDFIFVRGEQVAVNGFFVLSAFLLTYLLIKDFENSSKPILLTILKYFIRRFFRIYLVYFIVVTGLSFGPKILAGHYSYSPWFNLITLDNTGWNHLWTVPAEIKYYFFIPIFAYLFTRFEKLKLLILIGCILFTQLNREYNLIVKPSDFVFEKRHFLHVRFSVFFYGTIAAFTLHIIESYEKLTKTIKNKLVQISINISSVLLLLYSIRIHDYNHKLSRDTTGGYWSLIVLAMTLGHPNILSNIFSNEFLRNCGRFSFGIYLLHPIFIQLTLNLKYTQLQIDFTFVVMVKTYCAGCLFFYIIEKNCMNLGNLCIRQMEKLSFFNQHMILNQQENELPK
ncbi:unnamed protein product [Brachionus calyciflorus]|uniref:Acyltransferase 3 domain-containing protein n=1 Tax=Brachionus calyciflorus TaxID=104777 RepID=A0A814AH30_9BILA|nr:unnamed protein product [Brachionus calyciflorus]